MSADTDDRAKMQSQIDALDPDTKRAYAEAFPDRVPDYARDHLQKPIEPSPRFYAKSGGVWERRGPYGHGHLILTENEIGWAEEAAAQILNDWNRKK